ncbi:SAM-dependent methyltransferase [Streptacidiphilus pinicola]|uniref:SAM-dependent methyltransferase n=1 Tax=Streptacidiphilus pinicola TaxID=2219663 RepID=A0A2X0K4Z8_9ACTN|nr:SAM-dependent methyltransferase [Streptacidiphilus pinicola]RAG82639.1 SAM-dependent methyltransferase [Streptacidiphilus pinicola]
MSEVVRDSAGNGDASGGIGFDPEVPSTARIYDYLIGGKDNFAADRAAAEHLLTMEPSARAIAQANRRFMVRAVELLAQTGIRQYVDIGAGIPTSPNVHEVVRRHQPDARIVYVDYDPVVLAHTRALRAETGVYALDADMRNPHEILDRLEEAGTIDFSQPVGLLLISVMHFVRRDQDPAGMIRAYTERLAPGSHLVMSVASGGQLAQDEIDRVEAVYANASSPLVLYTPAAVADWLKPFELVEPGLVSYSKWRADEAEPGSIGAPLAVVAKVR